MAERFCLASQCEGIRGKRTPVSRGVMTGWLTRVALALRTLQQAGSHQCNPVSIKGKGGQASFAMLCAPQADKAFATR